ncbi:phosphoglycerate mutase family protein, partial [Dubosiella newyorkensis]
MRKKLFLVRHGQTLFNQKHKIQGWCDSPLTPKGVAESKAVGQYFRNRQITFDKACCSTLLRTE